MSFHNQAPPEHFDKAPEFLIQDEKTYELTSALCMKKNPVIWIIHHGEPLPLNETTPFFRSHRLARELAQRGYEVIYWTSTFQHHKKELFASKATELRLHGYCVKMLHAGSYPSNHSFLRFVHHHRMALAFESAAKTQPRPDLIISSIPIHYCALKAASFANKLGIPCIIDVRDYWPDTLILALPRSMRWLGKILLAYDFQVMKSAFKRATSVVSMMEGLLNWSLERYGNRTRSLRDRVFYLGGDKSPESTPDEFYDGFPQIPRGSLQGKVVVTYVGSFTELTHPLCIVEAARQIANLGISSSFHFLFAGRGDYLKKCEDAARGLTNISFLGWINQDEARRLNAVSTIGVIPSYEEYSFPNKTFAYLGAGMPVMCSEKGELRKLLEDYGAGYYFDIKKSDSLCEKLLHFSSLPESARHLMADAAGKLFQEKLSSATVYRSYADYIEAFLKTGSFKSATLSE